MLRSVFWQLVQAQSGGKPWRNAMFGIEMPMGRTPFQLSGRVA